MKRKKTSYVWSYVDLMFNSLFLFIVLFVLTVTQLKKQTTEVKKNALETDGLYAIVATWPEDAPDDVDLYVQDPSGKYVFYGMQMVELMHLEYDDRGDLGDQAMTSSGEAKFDGNRERVVIRGGMPGEYVVNVHMYAKNAAAPTTVKVSLYRLRGDDTEVLVKERVLKARGDEATAFRFTLAADGEMTGSNELPTTFVGAANGSPQQGGMPFPGGSIP